MLKVEINYFRRLTNETRFINSYPKVINKSDGDGILSVY